MSHDSDGSVAKDLGIQYGGPWFECWSVTFFDIFMHFFLPHGDCSIRVFRDRMIYSCLIFAL